ncbi:Major facilitator superfamily domain containing protein [Rhypophila sp. PSN 637]
MPRKEIKKEPAEQHDFLQEQEELSQSPERSGPVESADSFTSDEEKRLLRKLDYGLVPALCIVQPGKLAGITEDLGLSSSQYSMVILVFYIGYIVFGPPTNRLVVRTRPSIMLPILVIAWGVVTCAQAASRTYAQLVALRFLLGSLETSLTPVCIMLLSSWYRPDEQSKRAVAYTSSILLGGAFSGLLAGAIMGGLNGAHGIRGWRWLFIIEGVITIFWGIFSVFLIPDFPENSNFFGQRLRQVAIMRMKKVGTTGYPGKLPGGEKMGKMRSMRVACTDWRTWLVTLGTSCLSCSYVLPYFYPTLVRGLGYRDAATAQYMTIPIWLVALAWAVGICILADRVSPSRALILSISAACSMIIMIAVCCVYGFVERYILLVIMGAGIWPTLPLGVSFAATTFRDMEPNARTIAFTFTGIGAQLGNVYGAYLFPAEAAPKYLFGFGAMAGTQLAASIVFLTAYLLLKRMEAGKVS